MLWKRFSYQESKKERKPTLRGKWESVFSGRHTDNVRQETRVVSVMTHKSLETRAVVRDKKGDRLLPHPIRRQNGLTPRDINPHKDQAINRKTQEVRVKLHVDSNTVKKPSCGFWHSPVCLNYKSEKGCVYGDKCHFRHVEADVKPNKKSKKGGAKGSVAILKVSTQLGCVSQDSYPKNLFYVNLECWDQHTPSNSPKAPGTKSKLGKERVHREVLSKSVRLMSVVLARRNSRAGRLRRP